MRVLLFGDASSPNVQSFVSGLRGQGAEVHLASFETGTHAERALPGHRLGALRYVAAAPFARALVRSIRPDLVIGYFASGYGTTARLSGQRPLVQIAVGSDVLGMDERRLAHRWTTSNLRRADLVITWATHLSNEVAARGIRAEQILCVPRGINTSIFHPPNDLASRTRLITTRKLAPLYRHDLTIAAVSALPRGVSLTLVGDGSQRQVLVQQAEEAGLEDVVRFVGALAPSAVAGELRSHRIYVSTCPTDGTSASLLEAMSVGLLPVVFDHPANRAWIDHGRNGLFHDGTRDGLVAVLARATTDEELLARSTEINPRLVERRGNRDSNMNAISQALDDVISGRPPV